MSADGGHVEAAKTIIIEHKPDPKPEPTPPSAPTDERPKPEQPKRTSAQAKRKSAHDLAVKADLEAKELERQEADDALIRDFVKRLVRFACLRCFDFAEEGSAMQKALSYPERAKSIIGDEFLIELGKIVYEVTSDVVPGLVTIDSNPVTTKRH